MLSRRALLGSSALALTMLHPRTVYPQVDPATVSLIEAASLALEMLKQANEAESQRRTQRALTEIQETLINIGHKLETIMFSQRIILEEISRLRLVVREELYQAFRDSIERKMSAQADRYVALVYESPDGDWRPSFVSLQEQVEQTAGELATYDVAAFVPFAAGAAMNLSLLTVLGANAQRISMLRRSYVRIVDNWTAINVRGSLPEVLAVANRTAAELEDRISQASRRHKLSDHIASDNRNEWRQVRYLIIEGTLQSGFTGRVESVRENVRPIPPSPPPRDCWTHCVSVPNIVGRWNAELGRGAEPATLQRQEPAISPYPQVAELNILRARWLDEQDKLVLYANLEVRLNRFRQMLIS